MLLKWILLLTLVEIIVSEEIVTYKNYKLYHVVTKNSNQTSYLYDLSVSGIDGIEFLNFGNTPESFSRVIVSPIESENFEKLLKQLEIEFKVLDSDLSKSIEAERIANFQFQVRTPGRIGFLRFYRAHEINAYLEYLAMKYPQIAYVQTVGKSYEGRDMKTITISNNVKNSHKKVVFIDAGIHAREWISPATALFIIHQLVENFESNKNLLQNTDFIILPLLNPDGYEYSHDHNRFWRKTRKPNMYCIGSDANRNFDFHWAQTGVSFNECHEIYPGPNAFSEPESRVLRDVLHSLSRRAKMYLSLHSYGSYILYPWGWTRTHPSTWNDIDEIARAGAEAIFQATRGHRFTCGSQTEILYPASGGSHDYALGVTNIPISMTMELPYAGDGFHPHPSEIKTIVEAIWPGIKAMVRILDNKF